MSSAAAGATRSIIYLGMDVHKESITIALIPGEAKAPTRVDRLPNDLVKLKRWLDRVSVQGEIRACYEASGAGYVLHRAMREWGYACDVIAPSLIPKRPGVQLAEIPESTIPHFSSDCLSECGIVEIVHKFRL